MEPILSELNLKQFASFLKPRERAAHKGNFGHVLVIGGDYGYSGSVRLTAEAALRVGAGLVTVATRPEHALVLNITRPEIMCSGIRSASDLEPLLKKCDVIVMGMGFGQSAWAQELYDRVLQTEQNSVIDADALSFLAKKPQKKSNWILTPHPGEAAKLLKKTVPDIQKDRLSAVKLLQQQYDGICILKGAGTLIAVSDQSLSICKAGNPGMATAGMGDLLSGIIGGFLAQRFPLQVSAELGVLVHAMAADLAAREGERGMIASDLIPYLRKLVNPT